MEGAREGGSDQLKTSGHPSFRLNQTEINLKEKDITYCQ